MRPTLAARTTEPLAFADRAVNAVNDWTVNRAPWAYWPASPPSRRRPVSRDVHAAYLLQAVALHALVEVGLRTAGKLPGSRRLWRERSITLGTTVIAAAISSGAWDRRAARRFPPFR